MNTNKHSIDQFPRDIRDIFLMTMMQKLPAATWHVPHNVLHTFAVVQVLFFAVFFYITLFCHAWLLRKPWCSNSCQNFQINLKKQWKLTSVSSKNK